MSQTPSRRRPLAVDTPGSARSNTSTTSTTDRSTLLDRIEDLDLQVHDLRRQISAERERRRFSHPTTSFPSSSSSSLSLFYLDPDQLRDGAGIKQAILEKLRAIDDEALTNLLTASTEGLVSWVAGGKGRGWVRWVPSKSVGVEGTGSGSDIDRRLLQQVAGEKGRGKGVREELGEKRHEQSINDWLQDRQKRTTSLVDSLGKFTHLEISNLTQTDDGSRSDRDEGRRRKVHIEGIFARLFAIDIQFSVTEDPSPSSTSSSPQIQNLAIILPSWLTSTLDTPNKLYSKLLRRCDLPAILLMLRSMIPLLSLRRKLFTSLMEQYTHLVREYVGSFESSTGVDFSPWNPSTTNSSSRKRPASVDENLAKSLIIPSLAENFVLQNAKAAKLVLGFQIKWNRFGHAHAVITATADVPGKLLDSRSRTFLAGFEQEVGHMLNIAIAQDHIVGLPDKDDDDEEQAEVGRWGVGPALTAVIKAFFGLKAEAESGSDESG